MQDYKRAQRRKQEAEAARKSENTVEVEIYADMVVVKAERQAEMQGGGRRGACKGFSDDSRRRLIQRMAKWNLNGLYCYFITLTYPGVYAEDWHIWKRDVEAFFKRIKRKYDAAVGCCWRVEFQRRGAPHFHLILACDKPCKNMVVFRAEIARMWPEIVREGYCTSGGEMASYGPHFERHMHAGTGIEEVQGRKQLMAYVSKYLAKTEQANMPEEWGRSWGFRDINGELDFSPVEVIELDYKQSVILRRLVRRWLGGRGKGRYARRLVNKVSYSVLGLGADSNRTVYRMLGGICKGLFAPHISPGGSEAAPEAVPFIERVALGLVTVSRPGLAEGSRVITPLGSGVVSSLVHCQVLHRMRCSVILDCKRPDGSRFGAFDMWQVKPCGLAPAFKQSALW
jgi:hypothetical protein